MKKAWLICGAALIGVGIGTATFMWDHRVHHGCWATNPPDERRVVKIGNSFFHTARITCRLEDFQKTPPEPSSPARAAGVAQTSSSPKTASYDAKICKTDAHGNLYVAIGKSVFAFPATATIVIARYGNDWLTPPDATQPVGCPDNPEQMTGIDFPITFPAAGLRARQVQIIKTHGNPDSPDDTEWRPEQSQIKFARSVCDETVFHGPGPSVDWSVLHDELPNGLLACHLKHGEAETVVADMMTSYVARSEVYETPMGRPFVVNCGQYLQKYGIGDCAVTYMYQPGLGVTYRFKPYRGGAPLPVDDVIEFDGRLRAALSAALVKDYRWPEVLPGGSPPSKK